MICVERKGTAVYKIPKSVCCHYDSNFKVMVLERGEEIKSLAVNLEIPHRSSIHDAREGKSVINGYKFNLKSIL